MATSRDPSQKGSISQGQNKSAYNLTAIINIHSVCYVSGSEFWKIILRQLAGTDMVLN